ncbi:DUF2515 domain-containing protein [Cytobacillus purgationiresistens]|uniref:DUF2515 domain-containing protein n=1 Tax=Cytobacillus purgationiresistens TaxID=863449 RepID=A0ABU0AMI1_9BACI|nr:DUF2515 domain-containing protein [Cytobacillus purgationiresistens]MDQ0272469.1 hypothetical protein [Cytobacillus purgationiresistens]
MKDTLLLEEEKIISLIKEKTASLNVNNITRTKAYLDFYIKHPTIHWSFLAHMVSRNAGWNMTDLKGELLRRMLSEKEQEAFFSFMERANWLIFQDAFPQLLLYEESLRKGKPLYHLLHSLKVSTFMETIWNQLWERHDPYILTTALIVNEQNYIEDRVVNNPYYQKQVIHTMEFKLQDFFSFNHILFPYTKSGIVHFTGQTVHLFDELNERILLGKRLYTLLFQNASWLRQVVHWAVNNEHTGSRKDYWPHIFSQLYENNPSLPYQLKLSNGKLRTGASKFYSPVLQYAWNNRMHVASEDGDWYGEPTVIDYLLDDKKKVDGEIKKEYCHSLEKLELAVVAKSMLLLE